MDRIQSALLENSIQSTLDKLDEQTANTDLQSRGETKSIVIDMDSDSPKSVTKSIVIDMDSVSPKSETKSIVIDMDSDGLESETSVTDLDCDDLEKTKAKNIIPTVKASEKRIIPSNAKDKKPIPKAKKIAREKVPLTEPETGTINNPVVESEDEDEPSMTSIERTLELFDKHEKEDEARQKATAARKRTIETRKITRKTKKVKPGHKKKRNTPQQENKTIEMPSSSNQPPRMVEQHDDNPAILQSLLDDINEATRASEMDFTEHLRLERLRERDECQLSGNMDEDDYEREQDIIREYERLNAFNFRQQKKARRKRKSRRDQKETRTTRKVQSGQQFVWRHFAGRRRHGRQHVSHLRLGKSAGS